MLVTALRPSLAAALLLVLAACGGSEEKDAKSKARPPMVVNAQTASLADYRPRLQVLGTVTPLQSVAVRARVDGQIDAILFREGEFVRAGQVLFRLDPRQAEANVARARASLASAEAIARQADADWTRAQQLVSSGFISGATLDQKKAAAATADAAVGQARAELKAAQTALSYLTITAPVSGRTGELGFKRGATVRANDTTPLVTVNQLSPIAVRFAVPPEQIQAVRTELARGPVPVVAHPSGSESVLATGRLSFLDNNVDPSNGSVAAKAEFANGGDELWPGALVTVDVPVGTGGRFVRLPESALQQGQDFNFVWTVGEGNKAVLTKVEIAGRQGGQVYLAGGVAPGTLVVTDALAKLKAGGVVKARTGGAPPSAGKSTA